MPRKPSLSEFAKEAPQAHKCEKKQWDGFCNECRPKCENCGAPYQTGEDGACFDCRVPDWSEEHCIAVKKAGHGPGIIGRAAWEKAQAVAIKTNDGKAGPALRGIVSRHEWDFRPVSEGGMGPYPGDAA